jgi:hypothetical protein
MSNGVENDDLERRLRAALKPVDPGEEFARRVLWRIAAEPARTARLSRVPAVTRWLTFGLAASVVLGLLVAHEWQLRRTAQGLEARRQLIEALKVTDEKLDLAYRVVNTRQHPAVADHSGA